MGLAPVVAVVAEREQARAGNNRMNLAGRAPEG
jgi:hypothetical protein